MGTYIHNNYHLDVVRNRIRQHEHLHKFGHNHDIASANTEEDIWTNGGTYSFPSDNGIAMEIVSDNAADDADVEITVQGLDENFVLKNEVVTLNGTTPVSLTGLWSRVFRAFNSGSQDSVGEISIRDDATGTTTYAVIEVQYQQTMMLIYTVPADTKLYLTRMRIGSDSGTAAGNIEFRLNVREFGGVFRVRDEITVETGGTSAFSIDYAFPLPFPPKTDIKISGEGSANSMAASGSFDAILISQPVS